MNKIILSLSLLVITVSSGSLLAKWVCCQDLGGSSVSCTQFSSKEECNSICSGICEHIADTDKADTDGGVSVNDLGLESMPKKMVFNPSVADAYRATK